MDPLIDSKHKDSFSEVLTHLLANSSSHGLPNIQRSKHPVGKLFWALLFLAGVGVLCWQVSVLVATYRKRDVDVTLKMHSNTSIEFPVVTICNTNALKLSALVDDVYMLADLYNANSAFATIMQAYRNIEHLDSEPEKSTGGAEVNDYREEIVLSNSTSAFEAGEFSNITTSTYPSGEQKSSTGPEPSSQPMINNITYPTFANKTNINSSSLSMKTELEDCMDDEDYYNKMDNRHELQYLLRQIMAGKTDEQKATIGHEIQDLLLTCLWKGYPCSPRNFTRVWNAAYGNCYMFHVANSNEHTKPLMINKPGRDNGLTLELFVNQDNYIPDITETSGIRVAIHPHRVVPFPEDNGISLSPGYSTEIGLRMVNIERQPRPYGNCIDANNIPDKYYDNDIYIRRYRAAYSVAACEKSCYQNTLIDRCGCYDADYPPTMDGIDLKPCSILGNSTDISCMEVQSKLFEEGTLKCDCPQPCQEKAYVKSMSFSKWPAANYQSKLTSKLSNLQISLPENTGDAMKWIGDNLARVQIYFEELNYQSIKETPSYTEFDLCSDIGGQLGLWIGVSVITLCEMFEFFASIVRLFYRRLSVSVAMPSRSVTPVQEITLESLY